MICSCFARYSITHRFSFFQYFYILTNIINALKNIELLFIQYLLLFYQYLLSVFFKLQAINKYPMNSQDHKKFLQSIKQSQERSEQVLRNIQSTLSGVRSTLSDIKDVNQKIDKIKQQYNKVMDKLATKISNSFASPLKRMGQDDTRPKPTILSMDKAVQAMMGHTQILFVTGAGVSVDSGIPTFRGQNGLYEKKFNFQGFEMQPQAFINKSFFDKHPIPIWEWIQSLEQMVKNGKSNQTHILIHQCLIQLAKRGKKPVLVTQNIDDFHLKAPNNQYEYHDIHGVANKMRCKNLHYQTYNYAKIEQKCPQCSESLRPHVMFFDESYGIPFGQYVKDRQFDFVVVIGSSLNTGLCIKLVGSALQVIQINPSPVIEVGNIHPFAQQTNKVLEQMLKCIKKYQAR